MAEFPTALNRGSFDDRYGFHVDGVVASGSSSVLVASAREVNGDGFDDLIFRNRNADPNGRGCFEVFVDEPHFDCVTRDPMDV